MWTRSRQSGLEKDGDVVCAPVVCTAMLKCWTPYTFGFLWELFSCSWCSMCCVIFVTSHGGQVRLRLHLLSSTTIRTCFKLYLLTWDIYLWERVLPPPLPPPPMWNKIQRSTGRAAIHRSTGRSTMQKWKTCRSRVFYSRLCSDSIKHVGTYYSYTSTCTSTSIHRNLW